MRYMGSKNRLAKEIVPIIQSYITAETAGYLEPFTGGANVIDKIECEVREGYDIEPYVIACLTALRDGWDPPKEFTEEQYQDVKLHREKYPPELVGYCAYQLSYGGKFFNCYRRDRVGKRNYALEAYNFTHKQIPRLKGITFGVKDYRELSMDIEGWVIYCDPPYKGTAYYEGAKGFSQSFDHAGFYDWCRKMAVHNTVLISEYEMPGDFREIWSKPVKVCMDSVRASGVKRVEKLFIAGA